METKYVFIQNDASKFLEFLDMKSCTNQDAILWAMNILQKEDIPHEVREIIKQKFLDLMYPISVVDDIPIENLGLADGTRDLLKSARINTLKQLIKTPSIKLLAIKHFGQTKLEEVEKVLKKHGYVMV